MANNSNAVKLTFAGDTTNLERAFVRVQAGAKKTADTLDRTGHSAKTLEDQMHHAKSGLMGAASGMDGAMYAARGLGIELSSGTQSMYYMALGAGQLAHGLQTAAIPAAKSFLSNLTLLRGGLLAAGAALAAFGIAQEVQSKGSSSWAHKAAADMNYALATNVHFVTQGVPLLGRLTGAWQSSADGISKAAHSMVDSANAASDALLKAEHERSLFQNPDQNPGGDAIFTPLDAQDIAGQVYESKTPGYAKRVMDESGLWKDSAKAAASAVDAAAAAIKAKLDKWQSLVQQAQGIANGIFNALSPKLEAGDKGLVLFPGMSLLDKLKKQFEDTIRLKKDLDRLGKAGLSGDLLSSLAAGGLDSLPAADELLAGGKSSVALANKYSAGIGHAATAIGQDEALREIAKALKTQKITFDLKHGDDDLKRLIRKWIRVDGPASFNLKAA